MPRVYLVNARHVKNVPGRKADVKDSEWLAELARCGLLKPSFIPPKDLREIRFLTRYLMKLSGYVVSEKNRLHKTLDDCGIKLGCVVSNMGGTSATFKVTPRPQSLGCDISYGHRREHVKEAEVVVISSDIRPDNPEIKVAEEKLIPIIPRAEMLAELMRMKVGMAIAGTHGKTTTTSLIATIISHANLDPTLVIGGRLIATGSNARLGQGEFMIAEADESDGSFLKLAPTIAVVTNIDREHMEFFKTMDALKEAFVSFINKVPFYGLSIVCWENEHIREILPKIHRRCMTYGFSEEADAVATDIEKSFLSMSYRANIGSAFPSQPHEFMAK